VGHARVALAIVLGAAGCADDEATRPADLAARAPDLAAVGCNDPMDPLPDGGVCMTTATGRLVDEQGAPLAGLVASVCAVACYLGTSGADGTFEVVVGEHLLVDDYALHVDGRPDHASYYVALPPLDGSGALRFASPLRVPSLPASGPAIAADLSAQSLSSGDVTLTLAAGTQVQLDVEDVEAKAKGRELRVVAVDAAMLPFAAAAGAPDALYALQPFEATFSQPARVSFANRAALPAGAAVEVTAMHGLVGTTPPAGPFTHAATAHVSADGTRIDLDAGEGVGELTWLALKKK
jgi:hypothetical protein